MSKRNYESREVTRVTIKEIAKLANVSASTVSKIVNGKDENINPETRNRVLKVVKEYNYVPYSFVKNMSNSKTFLIGVLLNDISESYSIIKGILDYAQKNGYYIILCDSVYSNEEELKNITMLCKNKIDGVIWDKVNSNSKEYSEYFIKEDIPICNINDSEEEEGNNTFPFDELGYYATKKMIAYKHSNIGCILEESTVSSELFFQGYQRCLYDNNLPYQDRMRIVYGKEDILDEFLLSGLTGIICANVRIAMRVIEWLSLKNIRIPEDLSIIFLRDDVSPASSIQNISNLKIPFRDYGAFTCKKLIGKMEKNEQEAVDFTWKIELENENSLDLPLVLKKKKIVVVGSIHIDVTVNVEELPQDGKTVVAKNLALTPGGKGVNQAIGAARMGADTVLIGKVGNDYDGNMIYNSMQENHVGIQGIGKDDKLATGKAYIHVQKDGESSIVIYAGANQNLTPRDIERSHRLFENAGFCLLQTEIPMETVEYAARIGKQRGASIILKPSSAKQLSDSLLNLVDFFIPNNKEMDSLCPQGGTLEEKANYFLKKGVKNVIVTLGHKGCYLKNAEYSKYFPASCFSAVDTTGGADAFIATLAVYLLNNDDLIKSIQYATCAAGFVISRLGVVPALIDRNTLEIYVSKIC